MKNEQDILKIIEERNISELSVLLSRIEKQHEMPTRLRRQRPLLHKARFKAVSDYNEYSLGECRTILWNLIDMANKDSLVDILEADTYTELQQFLRAEARQIIASMIGKVEDITHSSFYKELSNVEVEAIEEYGRDLDNFTNSVAIDYMSYSEGIDLCLPTGFIDNLDLRANRLIRLMDQYSDYMNREEA